MEGKNSEMIENSGDDENGSVAGNPVENSDESNAEKQATATSGNNGGAEAKLGNDTEVAGLENIGENLENVIGVNSNLETGCSDGGPSSLVGVGPPSPLTGCYLLIILGEPHSQAHKDIILQRLLTGIISWDLTDCHVDLEEELNTITQHAPEGEEARHGERLIQYASENLVTEILIHPQYNTLIQCMRNLLSSFTRHRHIIHAGYTFSGNGSWILQDGTFSVSDFSEAFQEHDVQRVLRAYPDTITTNIHCADVGFWNALPDKPYSRACKIRLNPADVLDIRSEKISAFIDYLAPMLVPAALSDLLESSDVVGNIRFSHPTLYVFPGGQGDAALFGINGFNMLVDGGFNRKACFWDFARHLDRLDAVLMTRINNSNICGMSSVVERKRFAHVYPQIGHFFCNIPERKDLITPEGDNDSDPLLIELIERGHQLVTNLKGLNLKPQNCYRDIEPINLYHKVGHGTLDMYVISPSRDSKEVREFLHKWAAGDHKLFAVKDTKEFNFPIQNLVSICTLLVWQPANPDDTITRILFPGSTPDYKIIDGLEKIKHLEFMKHPICTAKTIAPAITTSTTKRVLKAAPLEKGFPEPIFPSKVAAATVSATKQTIAAAAVEKDNKITDNKFKGGQQQDNKAKEVAESIEEKTAVKCVTVANVESKVKEEIENTKDQIIGTDIFKDNKEIEQEQTFGKENLNHFDNKNIVANVGGGKTEIVIIKKEEQPVKKAVNDIKAKQTKAKMEKSKPDIKPVIRSRIDSKPPKSMDRKTLKKDLDKKPSPTSTPKKQEPAKSTSKEIKSKVGSRLTRSSPSSTPAKSAKEANNRKVLESKQQQAVSKVVRKEATKTGGAISTERKETKTERKPLTRRPRAISPSKRAPGSPVKLARPKTEIRKARLDKGGTTDSSLVSTPSADEATKKLEEVESSQQEIDAAKQRELDDLKEEQEVVREIEAVFCRDEKKRYKDPKPDHREINAAKQDSTAEPEEEEEYLIIEKEEIEQYTEDSVNEQESSMTKEEEIQKHQRDSQESEKKRKTSAEEDDMGVHVQVAKVDEKNPADENETDTQDVEDAKSEQNEAEKYQDEDVEADMQPDSIDEQVKLTTTEKTDLKAEVHEIIVSAEVIASKSKTSEEIAMKTEETSSVSPEDKLSSAKRTSDTKDDLDLLPEQDAGKEVNLQESLPEEKFSATIESGATTAPTLPEDERIPLDEIKEDLVIEEKYVMEVTKEAEVPVSPPRPTVVTPPERVFPPKLSFDARQNLVRDIVKTPDEVADLPVHEEADIAEYDQFSVEAGKSGARSAVEKEEKVISRGKAGSVEEIDAAEGKVVSPKEENAKEEKEKEDRATTEKETEDPDAEEDEKELPLEKAEIADACIAKSLQPEDKMSLKSPPHVEETIDESSLPEKTKSSVEAENAEKQIQFTEPENLDAETSKNEIGKDLLLQKDDDTSPQMDVAVNIDDMTAETEVIAQSAQSENQMRSPVCVEEVLSPKETEKAEEEEKEDYSPTHEEAQQVSSERLEQQDVQKEKTASQFLDRKSSIEGTRDDMPAEKLKAESKDTFLEKETDQASQSEEIEHKKKSSYEITSYTTELRETHITTLDSPLNEPASTDTFLTGDLNDIKEEEEEDRYSPPKGKLAEPRISPDIRPSSPREEEVFKIVANVAHVLKSEKDITEIIPDFDESKLEEKLRLKDQESSTVQRMLVTASSEDGGAETEICPQGSIKFDSSTASENDVPVDDATVKKIDEKVEESEKPVENDGDESKTTTFKSLPASEQSSHEFNSTPISFEEKEKIELSEKLQAETESSGELEIIAENLPAEVSKVPSVINIKQTDTKPSPVVSDNQVDDISSKDISRPESIASQVELMDDSRRESFMSEQLSPYMTVKSSPTPSNESSKPDSLVTEEVRDEYSVIVKISDQLKPGTQQETVDTEQPEAQKNQTHEGAKSPESSIKALQTESASGQSGDKPAPDLQATKDKEEEKATDVTEFSRPESEQSNFEEKKQTGKESRTSQIDQKSTSPQNRDHHQASRPESVQSHADEKQESRRESAAVPISEKSISPDLAEKQVSSRRDSVQSHAEQKTESRRESSASQIGEKSKSPEAGATQPVSRPESVQSHVDEKQESRRESTAVPISEKSISPDVGEKQVSSRPESVQSHAEQKTESRRESSASQIGEKSKSPEAGAIQPVSRPESVQSHADEKQESRRESAAVPISEKSISPDLAEKQVSSRRDSVQSHAEQKTESRRESSASQIGEKSKSPEAGATQPVSRPESVQSHVDEKQESRRESTAVPISEKSISPDVGEKQVSSRPESVQSHAEQKTESRRESSASQIDEKSKSPEAGAIQPVSRPESVQSHVDEKQESRRESTAVPISEKSISPDVGEKQVSSRPESVQSHAEQKTESRRESSASQIDEKSKSPEAGAIQPVSRPESVQSHVDEKQESRRESTAVPISEKSISPDVGEKQVSSRPESVQSHAEQKTESRRESSASQIDEKSKSPEAGAIQPVSRPESVQSHVDEKHESRRESTAVPISEKSISPDVGEKQVSSRPESVQSHAEQKTESRRESSASQIDEKSKSPEAGAIQPVSRPESVQSHVDEKHESRRESAAVPISEKSISPDVGEKQVSSRPDSVLSHAEQKTESRRESSASQIGEKSKSPEAAGIQPVSRPESVQSHVDEKQESRRESTAVPISEKSISPDVGEKQVSSRPESLQSHAEQKTESRRESSASQIDEKSKSPEAAGIQPVSRPESVQSHVDEKQESRRESTAVQIGDKSISPDAAEKQVSSRRDSVLSHAEQKTESRRESSASQIGEKSKSPEAAGIQPVSRPESVQSHVDEKQESRRESAAVPISEKSISPDIAEKQVSSRPDSVQRHAEQKTQSRRESSASQIDEKSKSPEAGATQPVSRPESVQSHVDEKHESRRESTAVPISEKSISPDVGEKQVSSRRDSVQSHAEQKTESRRESSASQIDEKSKSPEAGAIQPVSRPQSVQSHVDDKHESRRESTAVPTSEKPISPDAAEKQVSSRPESVQSHAEQKTESRRESSASQIVDECKSPEAGAIQPVSRPESVQSHVDEKQESRRESTAVPTSEKSISPDVVEKQVSSRPESVQSHAEQKTESRRESSASQIDEKSKSPEAGATQPVSRPESVQSHVDEKHESRRESTAVPTSEKPISPDVVEKQVSSRPESVQSHAEQKTESRRASSASQIDEKSKSPEAGATQSVSRPESVQSHVDEKKESRRESTAVPISEKSISPDAAEKQVSSRRDSVQSHAEQKTESRRESSASQIGEKSKSPEAGAIQPVSRPESVQSHVDDKHESRRESTAVPTSEKPISPDAAEKQVSSRPESVQSHAEQKTESRRESSASQIGDECKSPETAGMQPVSRPESVQSNVDEKQESRRESTAVPTSEKSISPDIVEKQVSSRPESVQSHAEQKTESRRESSASQIGEKSKSPEAGAIQPVSRPQSVQSHVDDKHESRRESTAVPTSEKPISPDAAEKQVSSRPESVQSHAEQKTESRRESSASQIGEKSKSPEAGAIQPVSRPESVQSHVDEKHESRRESAAVRISEKSISPDVGEKQVSSRRDSVQSHAEQKTESRRESSASQIDEKSKSPEAGAIQPVSRPESVQSHVDDKHESRRESTAVPTSEKPISPDAAEKQVSSRPESVQSHAEQKTESRRESSASQIGDECKSPETAGIQPVSRPESVQSHVDEKQESRREFTAVPISEKSISPDIAEKQVSSRRDSVQSHAEQKTESRRESSASQIGEKSKSPEAGAIQPVSRPESVQSHVDDKHESRRESTAVPTSEKPISPDAAEKQVSSRRDSVQSHAEQKTESRRESSASQIDEKSKSPEAGGIQPVSRPESVQSHVDEKQESRRESTAVPTSEKSISPDAAEKQVSSRPESVQSHAEQKTESRRESSASQIGEKSKSPEAGAIQPVSRPVSVQSHVDEKQESRRESTAVPISEKSISPDAAEKQVSSGPESVQSHAEQKTEFRRESSASQIGEKSKSPEAGAIQPVSRPESVQSHIDEKKESRRESSAGQLDEKVKSPELGSKKPVSKLESVQSQIDEKLQSRKESTASQIDDKLTSLEPGENEKSSSSVSIEEIHISPVDTKHTSKLESVQSFADERQTEEDSLISHYGTEKGDQATRLTKEHSKEFSRLESVLRHDERANSELTKKSSKIHSSQSASSFVEEKQAAGPKAAEILHKIEKSSGQVKIVSSEVISSSKPSDKPLISNEKGEKFDTTQLKTEDSDHFSEVRRESILSQISERGSQISRPSSSLSDHEDAESDTLHAAKGFRSQSVSSIMMTSIYKPSGELSSDTPLEEEITEIFDQIKVTSTKTVDQQISSGDGRISISPECDVSRKFSEECTIAEVKVLTTESDEELAEKSDRKTPPTCPVSPNVKSEAAKIPEAEVMKTISSVITQEFINQSGSSTPKDISGKSSPGLQSHTTSESRSIPTPIEQGSNCDTAESSPKPTSPFPRFSKDKSVNVEAPELAEIKQLERSSHDGSTEKIITTTITTITKVVSSDGKEIVTEEKVITTTDSSEPEIEKIVVTKTETSLDHPGRSDDQFAALIPAVKEIASLKSQLHSSTTYGDEYEPHEVHSPRSDISSGQASRISSAGATGNQDDRHVDSDEDIPPSPLSLNSQAAQSPQSKFAYGSQYELQRSSSGVSKKSDLDIDDSQDDIPPQYGSEELKSALPVHLAHKTSDPMSTSVYGALPEIFGTERSMPIPISSTARPSVTTKTYQESFTSHSGQSDSLADHPSWAAKGGDHEFLDEADLDFEKALEEHTQARGADVMSSVTSKYSYSPSKQTVIQETKTQFPLEDVQKIKPEISKPLEKPEDSKDAKDCKDEEKDPLELWGKPLGLPAPAPAPVDNDVRTTPKKERKMVLSKTKQNNEKNLRKRSESPVKAARKPAPVYIDLTYVPHHGNSYYSHVEFFKRVRARYYVFSGTEPSREVYNALLEAKQTWEDKDLEVTIIPTYDTDVLGYWVSENEELLAKYHIDLSPSASRCTINLQDHETSCSAYRLEF